MSQASKNLYIHRNTLTQRLDKFLQITGFDARKFMDGLLIYHLLIIMIPKKVCIVHIFFM